jgi:hypothetical protein
LTTIALSGKNVLIAHMKIAGGASNEFYRPFASRT